MTRNRVLALLGGMLLTTPVPAFAARRRGDGFKTIPYWPYDTVPFYRPGPELDAHMAEIDPLIRPAVRKINRCGWVWTAESCQGGHGWSNGPLLRLVFRTADVPALYAQLHAAAPVEVWSQHHATPVTFKRYAKAPAGWTELRVSASLAYFNRFANALVEHGGTR